MRRSFPRAANRRSAGALLQRLRESGRTGTGDFDAGGGGCHPPVRFHARGGADAAWQRKPRRTSAEETRMDFYKQQLHDQRHRLPPRVRYHCVDGYFAKKKYMDEVVA